VGVESLPLAPRLRPASMSVRAKRQRADEGELKEIECIDVLDCKFVHRDTQVTRVRVRLGYTIRTPPPPTHTICTMKEIEPDHQKEKGDDLLLSIFSSSGAGIHSIRRCRLQWCGVVSETSKQASVRVQQVSE
jgi:hypothetical protein